MAPLQKILTSKYLSGTRNRIIAAAVVVLVIVGAVVLAGGSSKSPEQSCELNLSNWVISTSNFMQSNPNSIPPLMNQFGTSSPITQWVDGQLGSFLSGSVQNGQASADGQLETAAVQECQSLASSGTNIGAIPAP
jgi:predicted PurR-regulated permease PerM